MRDVESPQGSEEMIGMTVYGLQITDLEPVIPDFGWTHTAYYDTAEEALEAAKAYRDGGNYELRLVKETLTKDGWKVVELSGREVA